jgi:hypothetical protein
MPKKILKNVGHASFALLEAVVAAADACPPLKSAAGGCLHIAKIVKVYHCFSFILNILSYCIELQIELKGLARAWGRCPETCH